MKCWNRNLRKTYNIGKTGLALPPRTVPLQVGGECDVISREHAEATHCTTASNNQGPSWKERRRIEESVIRHKSDSNQWAWIHLTNQSWWPWDRSDPEAFRIKKCNMVHKPTGPLPAGHLSLDTAGLAQLDQCEMCWASRHVQTQLHLSAHARGEARQDPPASLKLKGRF